MFLIDDIQFMEGKDGLQEEFSTFNELHQNNKQIVLVGSHPARCRPSRIGCEAVSSGADHRHPAPRPETRIAILRRPSKTIEIPDVLLFIAENITESIRN